MTVAGHPSLQAGRTDLPHPAFRSAPLLRQHPAVLFPGVSLILSLGLPAILSPTLRGLSRDRPRA